MKSFPENIFCFQPFFMVMFDQNSKISIDTVLK